MMITILRTIMQSNGDDHGPPHDRTVVAMVTSILRMFCLVAAVVTSVLRTFEQSPR
jgi:hypothetical protein